MPLALLTSRSSREDVSRSTSPTRARSPARAVVSIFSHKRDICDNLGVFIQGGGYGGGQGGFNAPGIFLILGF